MTSSPIFWEGHEQAYQRLNQSIILYDGSPCYVTNVVDDRDGIPRAHVQLLPDRTTTAKRLDSPKFGKFRQSVPLGYINGFFDGRIHNCNFIERNTHRTVVHGLNNNNTRCDTLSYDGQFRNEYRLTDFAFDKAFVDMAIGNYPSYKETVDKIIIGGSVAVSRKYAILHAGNGTKYLYRERTRVGKCPDGETVLLDRNKIHWKEELQETIGFKGVSIREG